MLLWIFFFYFCWYFRFKTGSCVSISWWNVPNTGSCIQISWFDCLFLYTIGSDVDNVLPNGTFVGEAASELMWRWPNAEWHQYNQWKSTKWLGQWMAWPTKSRYKSPQALSTLFWMKMKQIFCWHTIFYPKIQKIPSKSWSFEFRGYFFFFLFMFQ